MASSVETFWSNYRKAMFGTPRAWTHQGENLVGAFEVVANASIRKPRLGGMEPQALMLAGMAIETLLKAIIVSEPQLRAAVAATKTDLSAKHALRTVFHTHNLVEIAKMADVPLTPKRKRVAQALSQYIYWRGRYVVPMEAGLNDLVSRKGDDGLVRPQHVCATIETARDLVDHVTAAVRARLYPET